LKQIRWVAKNYQNLLYMDFIFQYYSRRLEFRSFCRILRTVNWILLSIHKAISACYLRLLQCLCLCLCLTPSIHNCVYLLYLHISIVYEIAVSNAERINISE
jgi:hypothetical protein